MGLGIALLSSSVLGLFILVLFLRLRNELTSLQLQMGQRLEDNVKLGFDQFHRVQESLKTTELELKELNRVGRSIGELNDLLKLPHLRGGFGEATLERLLCDLLPAGLYELQYRISPDSAERVDAVVKFPQRVLPIDSKFPREAVLALFETEAPQEREEARKRLVEVMKGLARSIREKYIRPEHGTTEMALLFVPSETLYFECLRNVRLCEELRRLGVFPVSPNTLAVTLQAVATSREYYDMARGIERTIALVQKAQAHFARFEDRFGELGVALGKAQAAFHTASTHLARYQGAVTRVAGTAPDSPSARPAPPAVGPPQELRMRD